MNLDDRLILYSIFGRFLFCRVLFSAFCQYELTTNLFYAIASECCFGALVLFLWMMLSSLGGQGAFRGRIATSFRFNCGIINRLIVSLTGFQLSFEACHGIKPK
jgi:hypothetical protein